MKIIQNVCEDVGNGWERPLITITCVAFRTGWKGAWDAIKAAWRKDTRPQLETTITTTLYAKRKDDETNFIWGAQVESGGTK